MHKTELNENPGNENSTTRKGVALRMLGVVAIILGILDSMLAWRGGYSVEPLYIGLIMGGLMLYISGILVRNR